MTGIKLMEENFSVVKFCQRREKICSGCSNCHIKFAMNEGNLISKINERVNGIPLPPHLKHPATSKAEQNNFKLMKATEEIFKEIEE